MSEETVAADIETCSAGEMFHRPDFFRLGQVGDRVTTSGDEMVAWLNEVPSITGHNFLGFDLLALARWHGADYEALAAKTTDTLLVERHLNPVAAKGMQKAGYFGLDATAERYGQPGKTDSLPALARKHGGYDAIPVDDADYRSYLQGDVTAQSSLHGAIMKAVPSAQDAAYIAREHAVQAAMGRITLEGFRVDEEENEKRYQAGQDRLAQKRSMLHEKFGMPLGGTYPHRTNLGKAAFRAALLATGIREYELDENWPVNKDGSLNTGKETLKAMVANFDLVGNPAAKDICETVMAMNGERTVYGTIRDHLSPWGRVHPTIAPEQGSGRWSVKDPGLTVLGKRGGKAVERGVLLPDVGDMLIAIDADQVDARVVAGLCQDPEYMKLFEPGRDLHSEVALRVFNRPECRAEMERNNGRCDCEYRDRAKVFGHGFSYGLGANGMARQHGVDLEVAQHFVQGMTEAFPVLAEWKDETRRAAGVLGFNEEPPEGDSYRILRNPYGRTMRVERNRAYTQATAMMGQGGTRDVMAQAILNLPFVIRRRVRVIVHDEIVLSIPSDGAAETGQIIADKMAFDFRGVPITFGCSKPGSTWAGCYGY